METLELLDKKLVAEAEVKPHGEAFEAVIRGADGSIRARGFGPTAEAALEDLHKSIH